jgi:hypothetical protein
MALPAINHPIHEVYLKSLGTMVKFRPFLVKEEKLLLVAKESSDISDIKTAIKQVIQNCCLTDIVVDTLPLFDIEMFFVHLRARSIGESAKISFTCKNVVEEVECGHVTDYTIDLNKVQYIIPENHNDIIPITDTVGIKLKYPTISVVKNTTLNPYEETLSILSDNLDYIYDSESIYKRSDLTREEIQTFFDQMTIDQVSAIRNFFRNSPKVVLKEEIVCNKCKFQHEVVVENLHGFFS